MIFINREKFWAHTWCKSLIEIARSLGVAATLYSERSAFAISQNIV